MTLCQKPWCYFISNISTGLRTWTNVPQVHLRLDALADTTVIRRDSNTEPLIWKTHALPIAPQPLPKYINIIYSKSVKITYLLKSFIFFNLGSILVHPLFDYDSLLFEVQVCQILIYRYDLIGCFQIGITGPRKNRLKVVMGYVCDLSELSAMLVSETRVSSSTQKLKVAQVIFS